MKIMPDYPLYHFQSAVKKTINSPGLDEKFESIKRSRKSYRSIMIALGKDMSREIMDYIMSGSKIKGKI